MSRDDRMRVWRNGTDHARLAKMLGAPDAARVSGHIKEVLSLERTNFLIVEVGLGRLLYYRDANSIPSWVAHATDLCARIWKIERLHGWVARLYREIFTAIPYDDYYAIPALEIWGSYAQWRDTRIGCGITDAVMEKVDWTRISKDARARLEAPVFIDERSYNEWKATAPE